MKFSESIKRRFDELIQQSLNFTINDHRGYRTIAPQSLTPWLTSALNLLRSTFGADSSYYQTIEKFLLSGSTFYNEGISMVGILAIAKEDLEAGIIGNLDQKISGEIFSSFINAAKISFDEKNIAVAAVLACAALEDALKRFSALNGLDISGKEMDAVIGALKSKGLISGAEKVTLEGMPRIRNMAMHADWGKLSDASVSSVISFTEHFLLQKFS